MKEITPVMEKFILHWGEMGARWGTNRTVSQIHALLYVYPEPLNAEQIGDTLHIARSNVSTSIRELLGWGIINVVNVLGDRKDYYEAKKDVWEVFRIIIAERKKREIDPTLTVLRECVLDSQTEKNDQYTEERLEELLGFFEQMTSWYSQINKMPTGAIIKLVKLGGQVSSVVEKVKGK